MSGHYRDTQTGSGSLPFIPKSHTAILINVAGSYTFTDRQGVDFTVTVGPNNVPALLPISVSSHKSGGVSGSVVYLV